MEPVAGKRKGAPTEQSSYRRPPESGLTERRVTTHKKGNCFSSSAYSVHKVEIIMIYIQHHIGDSDKSALNR